MIDGGQDEKLAKQLAEALQKPEFIEAVSRELKSKTGLLPPFMFGELNRPSLLWIFFFAVAFTAAGIWLVVTSIPLLSSAYQSTTWPSVEGIITESNVSKFESEDSDGFSSTSYTPVLAYTYEVDGEKYVGGRISFSTTSSSEPSDARAVIAQYNPEARVRVFYDPKNPQNAVLEPGTNWSVLLYGIWGALFVFAGILQFIWIAVTIRNKRGAQDAQMS